MAVTNVPPLMVSRLTHACTQWMDPYGTLRLFQVIEVRDVASSPKACLVSLERTGTTPRRNLRLNVHWRCGDGGARPSVAADRITSVTNPCVSRILLCFPS